MPKFLVRGVAAVEAEVEADSEEAAREEFLEGTSLGDMRSCHWEVAQVIPEGKPRGPYVGELTFSARPCFPTEGNMGRVNPRS